MHLSAMPTAKSNLNTHLGITIRWSASPRSYLPVASGGARTSCGPLGRMLGLAAAARAQLRCGGDARC